MQTIVINNVNDEIVERFKAFAMNLGVSMSIFKETTIITTPENPSKNLSEAILNIPKSDDNEDLFVRNADVLRESAKPI